MKRIFAIVLLSTIVISLNSCAIFKKRNKCQDCPKWNNIEMEQDNLAYHLPENCEE